MASDFSKQAVLFPRLSDKQARLVLVTGGARAGKSRFALGLAHRGDFRRRLYVATALPTDSEMTLRIAHHKRERNGRWMILEEPTRLPEKLPLAHLTPNSLVLLDCLPTFVTNLLLAKFSPSRVQRKIQTLLKRVRRPGLTTVFVSNEVGLGVVPEYPLGRQFRDLLGVVNQQVAKACDEVYLLVAGLPMRLK